MTTVVIEDCVASVLHAEKVLTDYLIPGILQDLSRQKNERHKITYNKVRVNQGIHRDVKVNNVYATIEITKYDGDKELSTTVTNDVWLASIPRLDDDGLFTVDSCRYYIVSRQRLMANIPVCSLDQGKLICSMRCENTRTLESISLEMKRNNKAPGAIVLRASGVELTIDVLGYMRSMILGGNDQKQWLDTMSSCLRMHQCSSNVYNLLMYMAESTNSSSNVTTKNTLFPHTIEATTNIPRSVQIASLSVRSDFLIMCRMLIKLVATECKEQDIDDKDDYGSKIADKYIYLVGKLFRLCVRNLGVNAIQGSKLEPRLFTIMVDAMTKDRWQDIVDNYSNDLKLSRRLESNNGLGIRANLSEVVTLVGSHASELVTGDKFDLRMLHPSQLGYVCLVRTPDNNNAGLKNYLASDAYITNSYSIANNVDDIMSLLGDYFGIYEDEDLDIDGVLNLVSKNSMVLWSHNAVPIAVINKASMLQVLQYHKTNYNQELSWSMHAGVLESRCHYGRWICKAEVDGKICLLDSRESSSYPDALHNTSKFSELCYEVPYVNMMPVARLLLSTKILHKAVTAEIPSNDYGDQIYLAYGQQSLVRTSKSSNIIYGSNVVILYTTLMGYGIEDAIVVNKASVERGLFSTVQTYSIQWLRDNKKSITVESYTTDVVIGAMITCHTVLAVIRYTENSVAKVCELKHNKPYRCRVDDVTYVCNDGSTGIVKNSNSLISLTVRLVRMKKFSTADKLASKFGQKAVAAIVPQVDLPFMQDHNTFGAYPDIIVNPLSIISRTTISQEVSTAMSTLAISKSAIIEDVPFQQSKIVHATKDGLVYEDIDASIVPIRYTAVIDGITGECRECPVAVGLEYYVVLNHQADMKIRSKGATTMDKVTGASTGSNTDTCVKYNWQELAAFEHSMSKDLLEHIYNDTDSVGYYPYCVKCDKCVDGPYGKCEYCSTLISAQVRVARPFMISRSVVQALGGDMEIKASSAE